MVSYPLVFIMKRKFLMSFGIFGFLLIVGGFFLYIRNSRINEVYNYTPSSAEIATQQANSGSAVPNSSSSDNANKSTGNPIRIQIDSVDIDVPIIQGYYNRENQKWTLSKDNAQFAVMTAKPNTAGGNTFIYGHNRSSVFARLLKIKPQSIVYVTTDNNQRFSYKLSRSFTTNPNDSSFLYYKGSPILTLQTCSGANFQNRTIFVFDLVGVDNV